VSRLKSTRSIFAERHERRGLAVEIGRELDLPRRRLGLEQPQLLLTRFETDVC
jgi:hypothetical protein